MKYIILGFTLICVAACATISPWDEFKLKFKKGYRSNVHEEERKVCIFTYSYKINSHNCP